MIRLSFIVLVTLGVFATGATLIGLVMERRFVEYSVLTAFGYLLSTIGFLFLVGWTYFKGHLADVEAPKNKVLIAEGSDEE